MRVVSFGHLKNMELTKEKKTMTYYVTPYHRMAAMRRAMNHWFEDSLAEQPTEREMCLAVDVKAGEEAYDITSLVPGLVAEDLDIEVLNDTVTIRGQFKSAEEDGVKYLVSELPEGKFSRTLTLPTAVDAEHVEASIKNGVLSLRIPKAEADRPKAIKITTMN
jgi:HSP20 family protein